MLRLLFASSLFFSTATGPGCQDIPDHGGDVTYMMTDGVLHANVTCPPGQVLSGSEVGALQVLCEGEQWSESIGTCVGESKTGTCLHL